MDSRSIRQDLAELSSKIDRLLHDQGAGVIRSGASVQDCMQTLKQLSVHVQGPEAYLGSVRAHPLNNTAIYLALDRGIVELLSGRAPEAVSITELAQTSSLDLDTAGRLMRMLVSVLAVADAAGAGYYKANQVTEALNLKHARLGFSFSQEFTIPVAARFADYLREGGQLGNKTGSPLEFAFGHDLWTLLDRDVTKRQVFDQHFSATREVSRTSWFDIYPAKLPSGQTENATFIVDVGGGNGQDIHRFLHKGENSNNEKLVCALQDLPTSLEFAPKAITDDKRVRIMPYDFFQDTQPITGACYYLMHDICHDYSDDDCRTLLSKTVQSMGSDSRLLIQDWVVSEEFPQSQAVTVDWTMLMLLGGGKERTVLQWERLLESVGLRIIKIWEDQIEQSQSVIETALKRG